MILGVNLMNKFAFAVAATLAFTAAQAATTENKPAADSTKAIEVVAAPAADSKGAADAKGTVKVVETKVTETVKQVATQAPAAATDSAKAAKTAN